CAIPVREQLDDSLVGIITRAGEPSDPASSCFTECLLEAIHDDTWASTPYVRRIINSVDVLI
ncbi:MAG TPA: LysR family transcriptional regulator, partial [Paraburkholderia sp.]|nr:LysR family transcriptional regulator [Paraburkholderia sp.]